MAIGVYVHPEGLTPEKYDEVQRQLAAAGAGKPRGRLHHSCFGPPDGLMVYSVWESQEAWEEFAKTLGPIREAVGITGGAPEIMPVHHIIL